MSSKKKFVIKTKKSPLSKKELPTAKTLSTPSQKEGDKKWEEKNRGGQPSAEIAGENQPPKSSGNPPIPVPFDQIVEETKAQSTQEKRGRGRPKKDVSDAAKNPGGISTSGFPSPTGTSPAQPGSGGALPAPVPVSSGLPKETLNFLARLPGALAAAGLKAPELSITREQAEPLVEPLDGVLGSVLPDLVKQYPQWFMLILTAAGVYGPGVAAFVERKQKEASEKRMAA